MSSVHPPRHIVWSTDRLDLDDPFQRRWYLRQMLLHGRSADIASLDLAEVERKLDDGDETLAKPSKLPAGSHPVPFQ